MPCKQHRLNKKPFCSCFWAALAKKKNGGRRKIGYHAFFFTHQIFFPLYATSILQSMYKKYVNICKINLRRSSSFGHPNRKRFVR